MASYAAPLSYGTAEPVRFDPAGSPLATRPILPEEMAVVLKEHLIIVFTSADFLVNPSLGFLTEEETPGNLTIVTGGLADYRDRSPLITVSSAPYAPGPVIPGVGEAGIKVTVNSRPVADVPLRLLTGTCRIILRCRSRGQARYLQDEVSMVLLRDLEYLRKDLKVRGFSVVPADKIHEDTQDTGRSTAKGRGFIAGVQVSWTAALHSYRWSERAM